MGWRRGRAGPAGRSHPLGRHRRVLPALPASLRRSVGKAVGSGPLQPGTCLPRQRSLGPPTVRWATWPPSRTRAGPTATVRSGPHLRVPGRWMNGIHAAMACRDGAAAIPFIHAPHQQLGGSWRSAMPRGRAGRACAGHPGPGGIHLLSGGRAGRGRRPARPVRGGRRLGAPRGYCWGWGSDIGPSQPSPSRLSSATRKRITRATTTANSRAPPGTHMIRPPSC